ncbi:hypothetical protein ACDX78_02090 [Virgibacillus oceani]
MDLINRAVGSKTVLEMIYIDDDNNLTQRFIRVLDKHENSILAYCYYRKKVRTFKMENILSLQKASRRFTA